MRKCKPKIGYSFIFVLIFTLFSCGQNNAKETDSSRLFKHSKIIVPKNQTISQSLSVIVKNDNGKLIVFDGGRKEDSEYLVEVIKENGGVVDGWYLTHIHDDHIGALYEILSKKDTSITIKNIYYSFADFDWYYEYMGNDAGIMYLFAKAVIDYNKDLVESNRAPINLTNKLVKGTRHVYDESELAVEVLNNMYKISHDPINNTSIVFSVEIEDKKMIIFGDLGKQGGDRFFSDYGVNESDVNSKTESVFREYHILVLAHHGQGGIDAKYYRLFKPKVVIWCTSEDIYENVNNKYTTYDTKEVLKELEPYLEVISYKETVIIE